MSRELGQTENSVYFLIGKLESSSQIAATLLGKNRPSSHFETENLFPARSLAKFSQYLPYQRQDRGIIVFILILIIGNECLTNRKRLETGGQLTLYMHSKATAKSTSTTHVEAERISLMMMWCLMFSDVGLTYLLGASISLRQRQSFYTGTEPKTQAGLKSWKMRRYFHLQASYQQQQQQQQQKEFETRMTASVLIQDPNTQKVQKNAVY